MTHSCSPNTIWQVGDSPDFKLRLRAINMIKKGEELTLSRIAHEPAEIGGTIARREEIKDLRGFECQCARCSSPTEFDSYISAIRCNFCLIQDPKHEKSGKKKKESKTKGKAKSKSENENKNSGYFIPVNPLVFDKSGQKILFKCNRCSKETPYSEFLPKIKAISRQLDALFNIESSSFSVTKLKNVIEKYNEVFLHPNHYLLQEARLKMAEYFRIHTQVLTQKMTGLDLFDPKLQPLNLLCEAEIKDGIHQCYFWAEIIEKIIPGFSYPKGMILANITTLKLEYVNLTVSSIMTTEAVEDSWRQIQETIAELDLILAYYENDLPSHRGQDKCDQYILFESQRVYIQDKLDRLQIVPMGWIAKRRFERPETPQKSK